MKIVSHQSLSNKFSAILKESQAVQLEYKSAVKDKLARQAKIYDNSLSNEQLEEIVNDPEVFIVEFLEIYLWLNRVWTN